MGPFEPTKRLEPDSIARLKSWASELPNVHVGISPTCQLHGYSGSWQTETTYQMWRRMTFESPNYAVVTGRMLLHIPTNGEGGVGSFYGNMQVQIGDCYAEFVMSERVVNAKVSSEGSMRLRNTMESRQRIRLEATPPA